VTLETCCAPDDLMTPAAALDALRQRVAPVAGTEPRPLMAARGTVLAESITAPHALPAWDNSAMDGWAVRAADTAGAESVTLPVADRVAAGHPRAEPVPPGHAVRIFTGAPVPDGVDAVVMQEHCTADDDGGRVTVPGGVAAGTNVRHAGEDVAAGATVLAQGTRLDARALALAAAVGCDRLLVRRPVQVAVFSTGDEVREPGEPLPDGGLYDANRYMLMGLLDRPDLAVADLGILPDAPKALEGALHDAALSYDVVITSGGVSLGEEDHVRAAVEGLGGLHFWRLAVKPGKPVALGHVGGAAFLGLPGNPVAALVTFLLMGRPLLAGLAGAAVTEPPRYPLPAAFTFDKKAGRREFLRARLADGGRTVERAGPEGSALLGSLVTCDGLVDLAPETTAVAPGDPVPFLPFAEVLP